MTAPSDPATHGPAIAGPRQRRTAHPGSERTGPGDKASGKTADRGVGPRSRGEQGPMTSDLLADSVLNRKAVIYVRQSTPQQVVNNAESRRRQYELVASARSRGFHQVEVIDDDQGTSANGEVHRPGFDKLCAELCATAGRCRVLFRRITARSKRAGLAPAPGVVRRVRRTRHRPGRCLRSQTPERSAPVGNAMLGTT